MYVDKADKEETHKVGEEKELALFFLDIRNFTPFMEASLPFDVIHIIRRLFMLFQKAIKAHNGEIIETAGDGLYAAFGFDTTIKQAAGSAYNASVLILQELKRFNDQYLQPFFFHTLNVGIGIHEGKVITGSIVINKRSQLTVMGLPVNIAARLQAATRVLNNNFIASSYCYSLIQNKPAFPILRISLKGITEDQQIYLLGTSFD